MIDDKKIKILEEWHKDIELAKNRKLTEFEILLKRYEEKFNERVPTEPSSFSKKEWIEILKDCLENNITIKEIYGTELDDMENEI